MLNNSSAYLRVCVCVCVRVFFHFLPAVEHDDAWISTQGTVSIPDNTIW